MFPAGALQPPLRKAGVMELTRLPKDRKTQRGKTKSRRKLCKVHTRTAQSSGHSQGGPRDGIGIQLPMHGLVEWPRPGRVQGQDWNSASHSLAVWPGHIIPCLLPHGAADTPGTKREACTVKATEWAAMRMSGRAREGESTVVHREPQLQRAMVAQRATVCREPRWPFSAGDASFLFCLSVLKCKFSISRYQ